MSISVVVFKNVPFYGYLHPSWIRSAPLYRVVSAFGLLALTAYNPQDTLDNGQSGEIRQALEVKDAEAELATSATWRITRSALKIQWGRDQCDRGKFNLTVVG